jgi:tRNA(Arg) A34 adenosine deaminase TadA
MKHPNKDIMRRAIKLAIDKHKEGGHAVAAIIVKDDRIIAEAFTTINKNQDPTCHAEINAIRLAAKKLHSKKLEGCYLYTTYESCPMCTSAAIWARMKGIVYGASREDQTEKNPWRVMIPASEVIMRGIPKLELYPEFMREECKKLLNL